MKHNFPNTVSYTSQNKLVEENEIEIPMMNTDSKIFVAGHMGMVGSALCRALEENGHTNIFTVERQKLDLRDQKAVDGLFEREKIDFVFLAAAKVGGIMANNTLRADFLFDNIQIQNNIIHSAYVHGVKKLLFLGSSCIYPRNAMQPLKENYLLSSELEYTNEPYAIAKIAGMKMCESYNLQYGTNFISVMPTNLYGYNDNFNLESSHVLPALMRKMILGKLLEEDRFDAIIKDLNLDTQKPEVFSEAEAMKMLAQYGIRKQDAKVTITLWGTGKPMREFLFADDLADACVFLMNHINFGQLVSVSNHESGERSNEVRNTHVNIGTGRDVSIADLAQTIANITGFEGTILWDSTKPDGTPRKYLDVSRLATLGWKASTTLATGIRSVYQEYIKRLGVAAK